jgi:cell division protease FtsH
MNDINDPQDFHDDDTGSFVSWPGETEPSPRPSATEALAEAALDAALTADIAALLDTRGFTLVLRLPGDDWISPIKAAVAGLCPDAIRITGRERYSASSDDEVCAALARGREVVGIASDLHKLPGALTRTADASLVLRLPIGEELRTVIADVTGAACPPVAPDLGAGLSLAEAASAIRPNDAPRLAIARLERAQASIGGLDVLADAPPLGSLHGYGVAMAWALDLTTDVAAYRSGAIEWSRVRGSALLASEPGLGKTTFARSLAKAIGAPLVATSVADWFQRGDGHLGDVVKAARDSHAAACRLALATGVALWFLDEIDALPDRARLDSKGRDWWTPVVAGVLKLLDDRPPGLVVLGATNHADRLDAALVRPGRLSPTLVIGPPDAGAVPGILRAHLGSDLANADLAALGPLGAGRTGAALAGVVAQARAVARREERALRFDDLVRAIAPTDQRPKAVLRRVAVHEAGHAVAALALGMRLERVSMIAAGISGGSTHATFESSLLTRKDVDARVLMTLAGRAAEEVVLGDVSSGAALDLRQATEMIVQAHLAFGLGESLTASGADFSEALALDAELRATVETELQNAYAAAVGMISGARRAVQLVADALIEKRSLSGSEVAMRMKASGAYVKFGPRDASRFPAEFMGENSGSRLVARRLAGLRATLGPTAGDAAARACRVAIGRVALEFAETRAKRANRPRDRGRVRDPDPRD